MSTTFWWLAWNLAWFLFFVWIIRWNGAAIMEGWKSIFFFSLFDTVLSAEALIIYAQILLALQIVWFLVCLFVPELRGWIVFWRFI